MHCWLPDSPFGSPGYQGKGGEESKGSLLTQTKLLASVGFFKPMKMHLPRREPEMDQHLINSPLQLF